MDATYQRHVRTGQIAAIGLGFLLFGFFSSTLFSLQDTEAIGTDSKPITVAVDALVGLYSAQSFIFSLFFFYYYYFYHYFIIITIDIVVIIFTLLSSSFYIMVFLYSEKLLYVKKWLESDFKSCNMKTKPSRSLHIFLLYFYTLLMSFFFVQSCNLKGGQMNTCDPNLMTGLSRKHNPRKVIR